MNGQMRTWVSSKLLHALCHDADRSEACEDVIGWIEARM